MTREEILTIAKPILFNTDMVRAILDGRKTAARRIIKCKYSNTHLEMFTNKYGTRLIEIQDDVEGETFGKNPDGTTWRRIRGFIETEYERKPYKKGQFLYVRETWGISNFDYDDRKVYVVYKAGDERKNCHCVSLPEDKFQRLYDSYSGSESDWRPSIHMPKEAARIFLRVKDVRAERLQDITEEQATKEGAINNIGFIHSPENEYDSIHTAKEHFMDIWDSTVPKKYMDIYG